MDIDAMTSFASTIPIDWIILGALAILFSIDALRAGPAKISALALALPSAMLISGLLPGAAFLGSIVSQFSTPFLQGALFLAIAAGLYILVRRMDASYGGEGQPFQALLAGCAGTAILMVVWLQIPALTALWAFGSDIVGVFGTTYAFWWLIGSYAALAAVRG